VVKITQNYQVLALFSLKDLLEHQKAKKKAAGSETEDTVSSRDSIPSEWDLSLTVARQFLSQLGNKSVPVCAYPHPEYEHDFKSFEPLYWFGSYNNLTKKLYEMHTIITNDLSKMNTVVSAAYSSAIKGMSAYMYDFDTYFQGKNNELISSLFNTGLFRLNRETLNKERPDSISMKGNFKFWLDSGVFVSKFNKQHAADFVYTNPKKYLRYESHNPKYAEIVKDVFDIHYFESDKGTIKRPLFPHRSITNLVGSPPIKEPIWSPIGYFSFKETKKSSGKVILDLPEGCARTHKVLWTYAKYLGYYGTKVSDNKEMLYVDKESFEADLVRGKAKRQQPDFGGVVTQI
jgi:hypothetical protein